jgi:hypothetical protein
MNRHQRRATATRSREGHTWTPDLCPSCNTRKVIIHAIEHATELRTATDHAVVYALDDANDCIAADFGVLQIRSFRLAVGRRLVVTAFGKEVFNGTPDGSEVIHPGPWIATLAAIRAQLDAQYGPAEQDSCSAAH